MNSAVRKQSFLEALSHVDGWLSSHEAWWLYQVAKYLVVGGVVVEIGSWKGKSTIAIASGLRDGGHTHHVTSVDPHEGSIVHKEIYTNSTFTTFQRNIRKFHCDQFVTPVVKTSVNAHKKWVSSIAFLFIDGLHDYEHTKEDYVLWQQHVAPGGIIAFHDGFCGMPGVWKAMNEVFFKSDLIDIGTIASIVYGIRGTATIWRKLVVLYKIQLLSIGQVVHGLPLPIWFKTMFIHRCIRLLLLNRWTMFAYHV